MTDQPESFLRWRAVCAQTGLSRATVWRLVREGKFPKPIQLTGGHAVGWAASEVQRWIEGRIARRDKQVSRAVPQSPGRPRKTPTTTHQQDA